MHSSFLKVERLTKRYPGGYEAVKDVSFEIAAGQMMFISGHSGAGIDRKSTRLNSSHIPLSRMPSSA